MATMNVSLSQEFADFVESQIDSGEYGTASEVVRDALRLLRREKAALKDAKRASPRGNGQETNPRAKRKTNEPKAAARGAASKLLGPDEGENHGR